MTPGVLLHRNLRLMRSVLAERLSLEAQIMRDMAEAVAATEQRE
jgi:hypothetical protein